MPRRLGVSSHAAAAKLGVPKQPIIREDRPSWVCVMKNPKHPPLRTEDGKLDRKFEYLTDPRGEHVLLQRDNCHRGHVRGVFGRRGHQENHMTVSAWWFS